MFIHHFIKKGMGNCPIVLSVPHGGRKKPKDIKDKTQGLKKSEVNIYKISKKLIHKLKTENIELFFVIGKIHRSKVDFNRSDENPKSFNKECTNAKQIYKEYHDSLDEYVKICLDKFNFCLLLDLHGFKNANSKEIIFGLRYLKTLNFVDKKLGCTQLSSELSKYFSVDNGKIRTSYNKNYPGGYIICKYKDKENMNAIMIEIEKKIRINENLTELLINSLFAAIKKILREYFKKYYTKVRQFQN